MNSFGLITPAASALSTVLIAARTLVMRSSARRVRRQAARLAGFAFMACATLVGASVARAATTSEPNVDRPGADLKSIELQQARPGLCRQACEAEAQCKAYTYVKPGVQGPAAHCWLKSSVPPPVANECCTSGVKIAAGQAPRPAGPLDGRPLRPATPKPKLSDYPSGAALWYMDGDISLSADFGAKGRSIRFYWNVNKVPNAKGVAWQVSSAPFANFEASDSDLHPSSIVASANVFEAQGSFVVDFAKLSETGRPSREAASHEPNWHVRILPLGDPQTIVGSPSNVIGVYAEEAPSSGPGFKLPTQQWYMKPGAQLRLTRFEFVPYRYEDEWPAGCEHDPGPHKSGWGWVKGTVTDAFDWTSQAYADLKGYAVTGIVTVLPVPRQAAEVALDAALASAGIPPSIPNIDQMMSGGADYLASQMADQLAEQVPAGDALAQLPKEELRKKVQQKTSQAIRDTAQHVRAALAAKSKYCIGMEYPPMVKLTIQNVGSESYQNVKIKFGCRDWDQPGEDPRYPTSAPKWEYLSLDRPEACVFLKGESLTVNRIDPGESQTIPVDIFSQRNPWAKVEDPHQNVAGHPDIPVFVKAGIPEWVTSYSVTPFRFTVSGGQGFKYLAYEENGGHGEEILLNDGTGFSYETPKRGWYSDAFVGP
jgi:PAN domain